MEAIKRLRKQQADILQRGQAKFPPVVWVMDLVGMRPRPTDWPDPLGHASGRKIPHERGSQPNTRLQFQYQCHGPETVTVPVGAPAAAIPSITITIADLAKPDLATGGQIETDIATAMAATLQQQWRCPPIAL